MWPALFGGSLAKKVHYTGKWELKDKATPFLLVVEYTRVYVKLPIILIVGRKETHAWSNIQIAVGRLLPIL